ncbi:RNA editing 3' terminal uridylyl transferase 1 [Leishmania tarentolae]|uniref:Terminal uridylyltransferase 1 n=1 Tax=Leishmania tarentolae TaxID=5689 RepID=TUT1_LEITA|nr:RecName: Full=Terminal uridylyltransferase 1; Short=TUTase 1; AltName: Full=3' terminal uridylyl transferase; Short=3' TUTase; AltName: Full=RNA editing terminal uridylyltransferase 1; Short=RET1; Short=RNA editing TUTase 1; Flags: Precursor [Leishmania tarentolae]AAK38333.1 3' terminal uridylyl transferase [Leishmania tarentolae]GET87125.1 RNA editing 3' terminal uridylyl transferase 1 [Leishmania tarentolae]
MSKYSLLFNQGTKDGTNASSGSEANSANITSSSAPASSTNTSSPTSSESAVVSPPASTSPRRRLIHRRHGSAGAAEVAPLSLPKRPQQPNEEKHENFISDSVHHCSNRGASGSELKALTTSGSETVMSASPDIAFEAPSPPTASASPPLESTSAVESDGDVVIDDMMRYQEGDSGGSRSATSAAAAGRAVSTNDAAALINGDPGPLSSAVSSSSSGSPHTPPRLFTCDMCLQYVSTSYEALEQHALDQHGDALADYTRLRSVAEKLVPVWDEVLKRKASVVQQWGKRIFAVAVQRDAGAEKMAEAHRARAQLELVVQRWHPRAKVFIFGSSVAFGVWDGISDIDFTVVDVDELEAGTWPPSEKNAVRSITELLRRAGFSFINLEPISHARVPIIKHHASLPIRLTDEQRHRLYEEARQSAAAVDLVAAESLASSSPSSAQETTDEKGLTQLEAELIIARSVRYSLNLPAGPPDSAILEASIRLAVGSAAVQQVWWNRTRDMCCMTFDTTTNAVKASTCPLHFMSAGMRARVQPLHEECRPELYGMDFDLSFRAFGIRNSHLLRRYLLSHPCARPGALVLKDWSKTSGVNNSVNGYLTSYAINIMWIYYLVHRGVIRYVCPARDIPASLRCNVDADPQYAAMVDPTWTPEERAAMEAQAGELLLGFFYYYAFEFDWVNHVVSLNRPGITTKASLGWDVEDVAQTGSPAPHFGVAGSQHQYNLAGAEGQQGDLHSGTSLSAPQTRPLTGYDGMMASSASAAARRSRATTRYSFCIEDPYEENLNLGRHMGVTKTLRVQTELYRGLLSLLKDDPQHCCVFAGSTNSSGSTDSNGAMASGAAEPAMVAARTPSEPTELPVRVLYKLMAISTRELAIARRRYSATVTAGTEFPGALLSDLEAAFLAQAPTEWKLARQVWNKHQLLHRLGLKLHAREYVLPRREVGVRRLAAKAPPGVVPASAPEPTFTAEEVAAAAAESGQAPFSAEHAPTSSEEVTQMNRAFLGAFPARRLPEDLMLAMTKGYSCLTPSWVAWSKPWAALSAWWTDRLHSPSTTTQGEDPLASGTCEQGGVSPSLPTGAPHHISAVPEKSAGAMHQTRTQLRRHVVAEIASTPAARRVLRLLFR